MLCFEGIALMLNIFLERTPLPKYKLVKPPSGELEKIIVKEDVGKPCITKACESRVHLLTN